MLPSALLQAVVVIVAPVAVATIPVVSTAVVGVQNVVVGNEHASEALCSREKRNGVHDVYMPRVSIVIPSPDWRRLLGCLAIVLIRPSSPSTHPLHNNVIICLIIRVMIESWSGTRRRMMVLVLLIGDFATILIGDLVSLHAGLDRSSYSTTSQPSSISQGRPSKRGSMSVREGRPERQGTGFQVVVWSAFVLRIHKQRQHVALGR